MRFTQIYADKRRRLARIGFMGNPLGCRSLFGRGNGVACLEETSGLCGKRTLPPPRYWLTAQITPPNRYALWRGPRQAVMTRCVVWCALFQGWLVVFKKTGSRVAARDDTEYSLVDLFRGNLITISPFHLSTSKNLSTFKNPADPVDPVIRVL